MIFAKHTLILLLPKVSFIYKKCQYQRNSKFGLFNSFAFTCFFFFFFSFFHFQIWLVNWPIEHAFYFLFFYIHMSYLYIKSVNPKKQWIWFIQLFPNLLANNNWSFHLNFRIYLQIIIDFWTLWLNSHEIRMALCPI